jgi:CBS domain-containing protein
MQMPLMKNKVRDLMVPIDKYVTAKVDNTLQEAVEKLEEGFLKRDPGERHRTILVLDESGTLVGIIDFRRIIEVLIPECSEKLRMRLEDLGLALMSVTSTSKGAAGTGLTFRDRALKNAQTKVRDIILKTRGATQADDDLLEAVKIKCSNNLTVLPVYEGDQLVGVLRDVDVFLAIARILRQE